MAGEKEAVGETAPQDSQEDSRSQEGGPERPQGLLERSGQWVLDRPVFTIILLVIMPLIWGVVAFWGGPSGALYYIYERPEDPQYQALVHVTEVVADLSFAVLITACTYLLTAALTIYGLIKRARRQELLRDEKGAALTAQVKGALTTLSTQALANLDRAATDSSRSMKGQLELLGQGWSVAADDKGIRDQLERITLATRKGVAETDNDHKVLVRSLLRGMATRFEDLVTDLSSRGSFMDAEERRKLTEELFSSTKSYHVIFCGIRPLKTGMWRWHNDYLVFLKRVVNEQKDRVTWTFADWGQVDENDRVAAIAEVQSLNIPCFIFEASSAPGDVSRPDFDAFFQLGPLIEVFGRDFPTTAQGLQDNALLTWKSTSLQVRTSGQAHSPWVPDGAVQPSPDEGVWAADNIDKLVRADVIRGEGSKEFRILDKICRHRVQQPIP